MSEESEPGRHDRFHEKLIGRCFIYISNKLLFRICDYTSAQRTEIEYNRPGRENILMLKLEREKKESQRYFDVYVLSKLKLIVK